MTSQKSYTALDCLFYDLSTPIEIVSWENLSKTLSEDFGKGFGRSNLYSFYSFYKTYPNIFQSVIGQSFDLLSWMLEVNI